MATKYCDHGLYSSGVVLGYISGSTLTVTSIVSGFVSPGANVSGNGIIPNTVITAESGTGGTGTYTVSKSQTLGSAGSPIQLTVYAGGAWAVPTTWALAQDGDGTSKSPAVSAVAKIDCSAITSGSGALISVAGSAGISITSGQTGSTLANTIATALNGSSNQIVSLAPAGETWSPCQVRDWLYARVVNSVVEVMTRAGSNQFNTNVNSICRIAFSGTWTGDTTAATTQFGEGTNQRGVGGAWGWAFSPSCYLPVKSNTNTARGCYGVFGFGASTSVVPLLAGGRAPGDIINIRANKVISEAYRSTGVWGLTNTSNGAPSCHTATATDPVTYVVDDGTEWPEDGFEPRFDVWGSGGYLTVTFPLLPNSVIKGRKYSDGETNFRFIFEATTGSNQSGVAVFYISVPYSAPANYSAVIENITVDASAISSTSSTGFQFNPSYNGSNGNSQITLINPVLKNNKNVTIPLFYLSQAAYLCFQVLGGTISANNPTTPHTGGILAENSSATAASNCTFYGVKFTGFPNGSYLHSPTSIKGMQTFHFKDCDLGGITNIGPFFGAVADSDQYYPSKGIFSSSMVGQRPWSFDTIRGFAEWNPNSGFPTSSATLLDGITPWSIRVVPASISTNVSTLAPFELPRLAVLNSNEIDKNCSITVEILIDPSLNFTKRDISLYVEYIDGNGVVSSINTFDNYGGALSDSYAEWSNISYYGTTYVKKKITIPSIYLKRLSEVGIYLRCHTAVQDVSKFFFVNPEPSIN